MTEVIEFLTTEFGSRKQYTSINTYRTAISTTHELVEGAHAPVGKHPMIRRLMQGVYNSRPPMPKYTELEIWDVSQVLNFHDKQEVNLDPLQGSNVISPCTCGQSFRPSSVGHIPHEIRIKWSEVCHISSFKDKKISSPA